MVVAMTRRLLAVSATALVALSLAGCSKPYPGVSVNTGSGGAAHQEALCWAFEDEALDATTCAQDVVTAAVQGGQVPKVTLVPGNSIGISVDPVVAEAGWIPEIDGQALVPAPITQTYWRFQYPSLQPLAENGSMLSIKAVSGEQTRGFWVYQLVPAGE